MAQRSDEEPHANDIVSSRSLTLQKRRLISSTGTLTSPPPLPTLTFDLIAEILCRLPVKLLIQLQCLGKDWKTLISDPKFAKKHLQSSIKRHHLMVTSTNNLNECVLYDSEISSVFSSNSIVKQTQINYPVIRQKNGYRRPFKLCSCDGILCFNIGDSSGILWNPSIRKFKLLPPFEKKNPDERLYFSTFSFGYDRFIDNYKIIVVNFYIGHNEVCVNTMGSDYWRRIHDFPFYGPVYKPGVFVSGTVNWLAFAYDASSYQCHAVIVSLDLEKESYQVLSQPDLKNDIWTLGVLRDCLCIFASKDMFSDVWIMKEYGNKESWTKLYSVPVPYIREQGFRLYIKDLCFSEDEQLLINFYDMESNKLELTVYDSKNGTLRIPEIQNIDHSIDSKIYIESLISPCS